MRENEENWKSQLSTVIIEIAGLNEVINNRPNFIQLLSKLEGLLIEETDFLIYRLKLITLPPGGLIIILRSEI